MDIAHLAKQIETFKQGHLGLRAGRVATNGASAFLVPEGTQTPLPVSIPVTVMVEESSEYQAEVILRRLDAKWKEANGLVLRAPGFF